jgi:hypothetical protein
MQQNNVQPSRQSNDRRMGISQHAPEWAEHARLDEADGPCDDGRSGIICGNRKGEKPCPS